MHNPKLLYLWTPDGDALHRKMFYLGENKKSLCVNNMDHINYQFLKKYGVNLRLNLIGNREHVLKYLIEENSKTNRLTYVIDLAFRVYPWYDTGSTELCELIERFKSFKGFDNLKWRFANTYDLYTALEETRLEWFVEATKHIKQENIILDFVNFDTVDLYKKRLPNATVNYKSIYFSRMIHSNMSKDKVFESTANERPYHVLCLNNFVKDHRTAMVDLCEQYEDNSMYSYICRDKLLDCYREDLGNGPVFGVQDSPADNIMNSSYTYIATETYFDSEQEFVFEHFDRTVKLNQNVNHAFITEKTLKSAYFKLPMIICGLEGSLKTWRRLGFESFPEFFDESYDDQSDATKRLEMIKTEVTKIFEMPKKELHDLYHSKIVQQKLEHNQRIFFKHFLDDMIYFTSKYKSGSNLLMDKIMETV